MENGIYPPRASLLAGGIVTKAIAEYLSSNGNLPEDIYEAAKEAACSTGIWDDEAKKMARRAMKDFITDDVCHGKRSPQQLFRILVSEGCGHEDAVWRSTELVANRFASVVLRGESSPLELLALLQAMLHEGVTQDDADISEKKMYAEAATRLALDALAEAAAMAARPPGAIAKLLREVFDVSEWKPENEEDQNDLVIDASVKAIVGTHFGWTSSELQRCFEIAESVGLECGLDIGKAARVAVESMMTSAINFGASTAQLVTIANVVGRSRNATSDDYSSAFATSLLAGFVAQDSLSHGKTLRECTVETKAIVNECQLASSDAAKATIKAVVKATAALGGTEAEIMEAVRTVVFETGLSTTPAQVYSVARSVLKSLSNAFTQNPARLPRSPKEVLSTTRNAYNAAEHDARNAAVSVVVLACESVAEALAESRKPPAEVVRAAIEAATCTGFQANGARLVAAQTSCNVLVRNYRDKIGVTEMLVVAEEVSAAARLGHKERIQLMGQVAAACISNNIKNVADNDSAKSECATRVLKAASESEAFGREAAVQAVRMMATEALNNQQDQTRLTQDNFEMLGKAARSAGLTTSESWTLLFEFDMRSISEEMLRNNVGPQLFSNSVAIETKELVSKYGTNISHVAVSAIRASSSALISLHLVPSQIAKYLSSMRTSLAQIDADTSLATFFSVMCEGLVKGDMDGNMIGSVVKETCLRMENDESFEANGIPASTTRMTQKQRMIMIGSRAGIDAIVKSMVKANKPPAFVASSAYSFAKQAGLDLDQATDICLKSCVRSIASQALLNNESLAVVAPSMLEAAHAIPTNGGDPVQLAANVTISLLSEEAIASNSMDPRSFVQLCINAATVAGMSLEQESDEIAHLILSNFAAAQNLTSQISSHEQEAQLLAIAKSTLLALGPSVSKAVSISKWLAGLLFTTCHDPQKTVQTVMDLADSFGIRTREAEQVCMDEIANGAIVLGLSPGTIGVTVKAAADSLGRSAEDAVRTGAKSLIRSQLLAARNPSQAVKNAMDIGISCGLAYSDVAQIVSVIAAELTVELKLEAGSSVANAIDVGKQAALAAGLQMTQACHVTAVVGVRAVARAFLNSGTSMEDVARAAVRAANDAGLSSDASGLTSALLVSKEVTNSMVSLGHSPAVIGSAAASAAVTCWRTCESHSDSYIPSTVIAHWQGAVAEAMVNHEEISPDNIIVAVKEVGIVCGMGTTEASLSTARIATAAIVEKHLAEGRDYAAVASIARSTAKLCGLEDPKASAIAASVVCSVMMKSIDTSVGNHDGVEVAQCALRAVLSIGMSDEQAANITGCAIAKPLATRLIKDGCRPSEVVGRVLEAVGACGIADDTIVRRLVAHATSKSIAESKAASGSPPSEVVRCALETAREAGLSSKDARSIVTKVAVRAVVDAALSKGWVTEICTIAKEAGIAVVGVEPSESREFGIDDDVATTIVEAATEAMFAAGRDPGEAVGKARTLLACLRSSTKDESRMVADIAARIQAELLVEGGFSPRIVAAQTKEVAITAGVGVGQAAQIATEATIQAIVHDMLLKDRQATEIASAATEAATAAGLTAKETAVAMMGRFVESGQRFIQKAKTFVSIVPSHARAFTTFAMEIIQGLNYLLTKAFKLACLPMEAMNLFSKLMST